MRQRMQGQGIENMKGSPSRNFSELEVKNFGPVVEAKIDLRPLTVFIGPSNTGKSYLAILIYALHRFFSGEGPFVHPFSMFRGGELRKLSKKNFNILLQWTRETFTDKMEPSNKSGIALDPIAGLIRSAFTESDKGVGDSLTKEIGRCFGIGGEIRHLIRKGNKSGTQIVFQRPISNDSETFVRSELKFNAKRETSTFSTAIPEEMPMRLESIGRRESRFISHIAMEFISSASQEKNKSRELNSGRLVDVLASSQLPNVLDPLHLPAFYLPADRTGVMHAHNVVVSALIQRAPMAGLFPTASTPTLSGVLADFLEQLIELGDQSYRQYRRRERRRSSQSDLGGLIERQVLQGSVHTDESETGYPVFTYQPHGWETKLPLMRASSMVSELAPVVLYLRHIVLPGNILIVEEPESHLHPAMQVEFTRQLAAIVNSGVRVIVTTHSEWLLEELANLVRLSELSKAARKKIDEDDVALSPDQVGAWLFKPRSRPKGSVVKEIPLDEESGLFPSGFSDVAVALHNKWADISSEIEGKR